MFPGNKDDLKPGTKIFVSAAKKQSDGTLQTPRILTAETARVRHFDSDMTSRHYRQPLQQKQTSNREEMMRSIVSMALAACAIAVMGSPAFAQTPARRQQRHRPPPAAGGTPDAIPFDIPYGYRSGSIAPSKVMAAAEAEAKSETGKAEHRRGRYQWRTGAFLADGGRADRSRRGFGGQGSHLRHASAANPSVLQRV